ncbi:MAG: SEC-C domain-containing protein, partial [Xanthomonadales bacterium]|nr:SEC-C domain-containing protein [Xanthomonadales bacterium]
VAHEVLNAKQHEREAQIVAQAGRAGAVTIATNMAGRGTDIVLGGNLEAELAEIEGEISDAERAERKAAWQKRHDDVLASGGLHIVGTERHESRRIDNQLRGRSGRQGDPGSSRFYISFEDNLMRIFGGEGVSRWMRRFGMKEDDALEDKMVSRQIEKAQRKVEQHNFDIRKHLLEFDDTANDQRKVIYEQRNELLERSDISDNISGIRHDVFEDLTRRHVPSESVDDQWDIDGLEKDLNSNFGIPLKLHDWIEKQTDVDAETIQEHVQEYAERLFREKETMVGAETMRQLEKHVMLSVLDDAWKEHLANMDYMRQGIYLRSYAQVDPKQEFKREAFRLFSETLDKVKNEVTQVLARIRVRSEEEVAAMEEEQRRQQASAALSYQHAEASGMSQEPAMAAADGGAAGGGSSPVYREGPKVGRNDPCPCGSGKKYKHCHGVLG